VVRLDAAVGHLLDELDNSTVADTTAIVFTADHGAAFPRSKLSVYESGVAAPLIVALPPKFVVVSIQFC
jgi:N-sulfoglucosamine sulfohydrolase